MENMTLKEVAAKAARNDLDVCIRDFNPHFEGDWREAGYETLHQLMDAQDGKVDANVEFDGHDGKLVDSNGCGCCGGEAGYEFKVGNMHRANWSLAQC